ncbi:unnamed protein product [Scytosiphon promiscuus]
MSASAEAAAPGEDGGMAPVAAKTDVIIGNLKRDVDMEALKALLCQLGRLTNFRLQQPPGIDPNSPATGIVEYASAEDATRVVSHVHGKLILGRPVTAWIATPGSSAKPPVLGASTPNPPPSTTASPGPSRATYQGKVDRRNPTPSHGQNGGRYPPAAGDNGSHDNQRWERPPGPQQGQRVPDRGPPPRVYNEDYPNPRQQQQQQQQHQQQAPPPQQQRRPQQPQQQPWRNGRPAPPSGMNPAGAARYRGEDEPARYPEQQQQQQWHEHGHGEEDEAALWEPSGRNHYPPPAHRAPVRRDPAAPYHPPAGAGPRSSGWYDEADSRDAPPGPHAAYGDGAQLRAPPPGRAMMPRGVSGGSLGVPPRSDDGYGDEDVPAGERPRARAPRSVRPPGRAASWTNDAEYSVPPPPISIKGEDFEKEVVKAAALLVAEREMRAREEARKKGKGDQKTAADDDEPASGREERKKSKKGDGKARGSGRPAGGGEDSEKRKKRESSSHKDDKGDDARPKSKKTRRVDGSPHGGGRADGRSEDRHGPSGRRSVEPKGKVKTRDESRGRQEGEDGDRYHEDGGRRKHKDKDQDPRGNDSWPRPGGGGGAGSPRENPWESSTADSGYYVHVGGLSFSTTFTTLAKRFAAFGDVTGFKAIFNKVSCRTAETSGRRGSKEEAAKAAVLTASSGFAFISFENERGMEKAVEGMDGQMMDGHVLKVSRGHGPRMAGKPPGGFNTHRPQGQGGPAAPSQRAPHRFPEPKNNEAYDQGYKTKPRLDRGDRRSIELTEAIREASQSARRGGGAGRPGGGKGPETDRGGPVDPLGALRSPRPAISSRKEATPSARPPEANGRFRNGYGVNPGNRDDNNAFRTFRREGGEDTRPPNSNRSATWRADSRPGARPMNAARGDTRKVIGRP